MLAVCRMLGIPSRYVSGYLNPELTPNQSVNMRSNGYQAMSQQQMMDQ